MLVLPVAIVKLLDPRRCKTTPTDTGGGRWTGNTEIPVHSKPFAFLACATQWAILVDTQTKKEKLDNG
jgi:hypothetical protein